MQVETFEISEIVDEIPEDTAECQRLIAELGIEAPQGKFYASTDGAQDKGFPYRKMTAQEKVVYSILCPSHCELVSYSDGPIPLRVLQVAAYANECGPQEGLCVIWYPNNADVKDPILLWKEKTGSYSYSYYILARWGEILENFNLLTKQAKEMWLATEEVKIRKIAHEANHILDNLPARFQAGLTNGSIPNATAYFD